MFITLESCSQSLSKLHHTANPVLAVPFEPHYFENLKRQLSDKRLGPIIEPVPKVAFFKSGPRRNHNWGGNRLASVLGTTDPFADPRRQKLNVSCGAKQCHSPPSSGGDKTYSGGQPKQAQANQQARNHPWSVFASRVE